MKKTGDSTALLLFLIGAGPILAQPIPPFADEPAYTVSVRPVGGRLTLRSSDGSSLVEARPYLCWRPAGQANWQQSAAQPLILDQNTPDALQFRTQLGPVLAHVTARRVNGSTWVFAGQLTNTGASAVDLARFHYLHGRIEPTNTRFLGMDGRLLGRPDTLPAQRVAVERLWTRFNVSWPHLSEPIHDQPNWATSVDVGILTPAYNRPGWFVGFTGPGTAFGEVGFRTQVNPSVFYAAVLLDNVRLESGQSRALETCRVAYGDWQRNLQGWADACAQVANVSRPKPPLVGYCSWYQFAERVKPTHLDRAIEEVAALPAPPGGRAVQLDDGFERMPGDWRPNERFVRSWDSLPARIARTGSVPGLWLAPTAIHARHPLVQAHPDWLQRWADGRPAVSFSNWGWCADSTWRWGRPGDKTYFLEMDRPEAKAFIASLFADVKRQGWQYLKIDFTYALSTARVPYDRSKTRFESLRDLYALFRRASGPNLLLNACIGEPGRYALGQVDVARLGGDIGTDWKTVQGNLRALLMAIPTNGVWWQGDPDVFYLRRDRNPLTDEENYLLTSSIGLMGGLLLTSDFPSQWSARVKERLKPFWNAAGPRVPSRHRILYSPDGEPLAYLVSYNDGNRPQHRVGLYNWADQPRSVVVPLTDLGFRSGVNWQVRVLETDQPTELRNGALRTANQPAHSLRVFELTQP